MEHLEDLAIETSTGWRFVQIKTKDQELGPWTLTELTGNSGALKSLLRTHYAIGKTDCTLEAWLAGAIKRGDLLEALKDKESPLLPQCIKRVSERLEITESEATEFIERVQIIPRMPARDSIEDSTIRYITRIAGEVTSSTIQDVHDDLLFAIYDAMRAANNGLSFPMSILNPELLNEEQRLRVEAKRLTREQLREITAPLRVPSRTLIKRYVESSEGPPTNLEMKLIAGGAASSTIEHAKTLRANATMREIEIMASKGNDEPLIELRLRLGVLADAQISRFLSADKPAVEAWAAILSELGNQSSNVDPDRIFGSDSFLLLGEICELTDLCELEWGIASED